MKLKNRHFYFCLVHLLRKFDNLIFNLYNFAEFKVVDEMTLIIKRKESLGGVFMLKKVLFRFFLLTIGVIIFSVSLYSQQWEFERMWSVLDQPWYFSFPYGIAVDTKTGNVYVADTDNHRIQVFTSTGGYIMKWGSYGSGNGQFSYPSGVSVDGSGNVYVADTSNNRIQVFTSTGGFITKWGSRGSGNGEFYGPYGVSVDGSGNVYVADYGNDRIQKFSSTGEYITQWGSYGSGDGQFYGPYGVSVDSSGNVYVADTDNHRIQVFTSTGGYIMKWGSYGSGDGEFNGPSGVSVDSSGNVYVADTDNHRIQVFTSTGGFITKWGSRGSGNGQFSYPSGVSVDGSGNVYVADTSNHRIQKFVKKEETKEVTIDPSVEQKITIKPPTGDIEINIPANTFFEQVKMKVSTTSVPSSDRQTIKKTNIGIEITTDKGLQPTKEITITINYSDSDVQGLDESKLVIARYDEEHKRWIPLSSEVDPANNKVTAKTAHLSKFAIVQLASASNLSELRAYPNPYNPNKHTKGLTIEGLTDTAEIKIYTITGEMVCKVGYDSANGRTFWDGKNDSGEKVASGIYIIYVDSGNEKKKLKIAVEK